MLPYILEQPLIECYYGLCGENGRTLCNGGNPLGGKPKKKKKSSNRIPMEKRTQIKWVLQKAIWYFVQENEHT